MLRVMARLNLTLDNDTENELREHASTLKVSVATLARALIVEAIGRRKRLAFEQRMAQDYAAQWADADCVDEALEAAQLADWDATDG